MQAAIALVGYAGFLSLVFIVRTDPWRWVGFASRADAAAGVLLIVAVSCSLVSLLLVLLGGLQPWGTSPAVSVAGVLLLTVGVAVALEAQRQLGPAWRPGIERRDRPLLVTSGLYRCSRNPFYVGWILVAAGAAVLSPAPLTVAGLVGLIASLEVVVRLVEEPALTATLGRPFAEYERGTRRFV